MTDIQLVKEQQLSFSRAKQQRIAFGKMAPIGMDGVMSWFSSPEVGIISLVAFFILSITLLALCARCNRGSNAYDVNGTMTDGGANGNIKAGDADVETQTAWRDHKSMPPSTLRRH